MSSVRATRTIIALGAVSALFTLSACGGDDDDTSSDETPDTATTSEDSHDDGHDHSHGGDDEGSMTGDTSATAANDIAGADVAEATFTPLESAPSGTENVAGTAWLARHDAGTTVTIEVTELPPDTPFMSHLHADSCSDDGGGPHFKFDPDGSDQPPNEVHLMFQSDADGIASTTVENENPESEGAQSIVLHLDDTKVACANF